MEVLRELINGFEPFVDGLPVIFVLQYLFQHSSGQHVLQYDGFGDKFPSINRVHGHILHNPWSGLT